MMKKESKKTRESEYTEILSEHGVTIEGTIQVDQNVRKEIEKLARNNEYTIYVELENSSVPVPVAEIKKCDVCPEWLFDKVIKQILEK